jgi:hypothetical protein
MADASAKAIADIRVAVLARETGSACGITSSASAVFGLLEMPASQSLAVLKVFNQEYLSTRLSTAAVGPYTVSTQQECLSASRVP